MAHRFQRWGRDWTCRRVRACPTNSVRRTCSPDPQRPPPCTSGLLRTFLRVFAPSRYIRIRCRAHARHTLTSHPPEDSTRISTSPPTTGATLPRNERQRLPSNESPLTPEKSRRSAQLDLRQSKNIFAHNPLSFLNRKNSVARGACLRRNNTPLYRGAL